jgi:hypothetical protein
MWRGPDLWCSISFRGRYQAIRAYAAFAQRSASTARSQAVSVRLDPPSRTLVTFRSDRRVRPVGRFQAPGQLATDRGVPDWGVELIDWGTET